MKNQDILQELESLYQGFLKTGNQERAHAVLQDIMKIKSQNESAPDTKQDVLLG